MENLDINNPEQLKNLLGEILDDELRWFAHREEFCGLVERFVEEQLRHEIVSCHIIIDSMNECIKIGLHDGGELEFIFKDFRSQRIRDHRNSKKFGVTILETIADQKKPIVKEKLDLRCFKGNNEWVVRINDNHPQITSPFTEFPDSFNEFEKKDLENHFVLGNPALLSLSIVSIFNAM